MRAARRRGSNLTDGMARRMEIELTSRREDGIWTWRAAGARQPKGIVAASLLTSAAKVGDVLRVEAETELDGIAIVSVLPPKEHAPLVGLIEVRPERSAPVGVTTSLISPAERRGRDRRPGGRDDAPRRDRPAAGARTDRSGRPAPERGARSPVERAGRPASEGRGAPRAAGERTSPERTGAAERPQRSRAAAPNRTGQGRPAGRPSGETEAAKRTEGAAGATRARHGAP